MSICPE